MKKLNQFNIKVRRYTLGNMIYDVEFTKNTADIYYHFNGYGDKVFKIGILLDKFDIERYIIDEVYNDLLYYNDNYLDKNIDINKEIELVNREIEKINRNKKK